MSGGALFRPRDGSSATHVAAIWIHGSGVNFYYPIYVKIARELAKRGCRLSSATLGCTTSATLKRSASPRMLVGEVSGASRRRR